MPINTSLQHDEIDNTEVNFGAGKLKSRLFTANRQTLLSQIVAKHNNEWSSNRVSEFFGIIELYKKVNKPETATNIEKRLAELAIDIKIKQFDTDKSAYFIPCLIVRFLYHTSMKYKSGVII